MGFGFFYPCIYHYDIRLIPHNVKLLLDKMCLAGIMGL